MKFRIGEKVVCITDIKLPEAHRQLGTQYPKKDKTYTVRGYGSDGTAIFLVEIVNPVRRYLDGRQEAAFLKSILYP